MSRQSLTELQEGAALGDIRVAPLLGLGIGRTANHRFRAVSFDLRDLGGRGDFRHEDARADPELLGGESDGGAVIAARGGGATGRGCWSRKKIVEGAARFERTCRLQATTCRRSVRPRSKKSPLRNFASGRRWY